MSATEMKYNYRSDTVAFEVILLCVFHLYMECFNLGLCIISLLRYLQHSHTNTHTVIHEAPIPWQSCRSDEVKTGFSKSDKPVSPLLRVRNGSLL